MDDDDEVRVMAEGFEAARRGVTIWRWEDAPEDLRELVKSEITAYIAYIPPSIATDAGFRALFTNKVEFEYTGDEGFVCSFNGPGRGTLLSATQVQKH